MPRGPADFPDLPESFLKRYFAQKTGGGNGILSGARGGLLGRSTPMSAEDERRDKYGPYWAFWSSPEYAAIHDAHRQETEQRRREYEEREKLN
jgi:hypothetical protein